MAATILNTTDLQALRQRMQALTAAAQRRWGSMQATEMLWHLRMQLELALGLRPLHTQARSALRLPPLRWLALYVIPWPKGSATAPEMNVRKQHPAVQDFATEQRLLLQRLDEVLQAQQLGSHPLFGAMNKKESVAKSVSV